MGCVSKYGVTVPIPAGSVEDARSRVVFVLFVQTGTGRVASAGGLAVTRVCFWSALPRPSCSSTLSSIAEHSSARAASAANFLFFLPFPRVRRLRDLLVRLGAVSDAASSVTSAHEARFPWTAEPSVRRGEGPPEDSTSDLDPSVAASVDACVTEAALFNEDLVRAT